MDLGGVRGWMEGYVRAWESNDPAAIASLFSSDARYYTAPWREAWRGRNGIIEGWLGRREQQGRWSFRWEPVVLADDVAVITGRTMYHHRSVTYWNLFVLRFDGDGRCLEFTEWWMEEER